MKLTDFAFWRRSTSTDVPATERPTRNFSYTPTIDDYLQQRASQSVLTRQDAMSVPAVLRSRNLIASIATLPLEQVGSDNVVVESVLLAQLDDQVPNLVTLSQTVEDLLLVGTAWWRITATDWRGYPAKVRRVDPSLVSTNPPIGRSQSPLPSGIDPRDGKYVWIDGLPVPIAQIIRFDSPNPPILVVGARTILRAILLDQLAKVYANSPVPSGYFTSTPDGDLTDDEILNAMSQWVAARKRNGTGYIPKGLEYHTVDMPSPHELQLVELQKQVATEIANLFGLESEDLNVSTTSRTYANIVDNRRERINDVLMPYMQAITQRLSMGDVTPRGNTVRFVLDDYLRANPTERAAVQKQYLEMGVITVDDIRAEEGLPPLEQPVAIATPPDPTTEPETPTEEVPE